LIIGVFPFCLSSLVAVTAEQTFSPYWLALFNHMVHHIFICCVVLYLMSRSELPLSQFGINRPRAVDLIFGMLLVPATGVLMLIRAWILPLPYPDWARSAFATPVVPIEKVLIALNVIVGAFMEELITRGYLITRFEQLLDSQVKAVIYSAVLFSSYHFYQGAPVVVDAFLFGVLAGTFFAMTRRLWPITLAHLFFNMRVEVPVNFFKI
jgi:membrane protease YdiL (CAAX protease family)